MVETDLPDRILPPIQLFNDGVLDLDLDPLSFGRPALLAHGGWKPRAYGCDMVLVSIETLCLLGERERALCGRAEGIGDGERVQQDIRRPITVPRAADCPGQAGSGLSSSRLDILANADSCRDRSEHAATALLATP